ncbi:hypothetical protein Tco_0434376 [Tanacetum coccineum]
MMIWLKSCSIQDICCSFGVDIPTAQSQLIKSTQGTHRITKALRLPHPDMDEGESSRNSTVIRLRIPLRQSSRLNTPTPILTTTEVEDIILHDIIQLSIAEKKSRDDFQAKQNEEKVKEHLMAEETEKLVEGTENIGEDKVDNSILNSQNDPGTRLEPMIYKESLKVEKIVVVSQLVNVIEEEDELADDDYVLRRREREGGRYGYLFGHLKTRFLARKKFNVLAQHLQEVMEGSLTNMVDDHVKELTKTRVPIYVAQGLIMERQQSQANVAKMIADAIQQEHKNLLAEIPSQINNDDPHDDVHPKGENNAKRQKTSEHGTYVFRESSYGQDNESELGPSTSELVKEMSQIVYEAKLCKVVDEMLRQRFTLAYEHQYHIAQMQNFLKNDIIWENIKDILSLPFLQKPTTLIQSCQRDLKAPTLSLVYQDLLYLKKGNSGLEKIVLSLPKFLAVTFHDDDIKERTSKWVDKCVNKFNPYARYIVEH